MVVPFEILLKPNHGPIGTAVTAAAGGRLCDGTVTFRWKDSDEPWSATEEVDGVYNATSTVAAQLAPGAHDVAAECNVFEGSPDFTWRPATFTVVPLELGIQPNRGPVGTSVRATARGFSCPEVVFIWSGESDGTRAPVHLDVATATVTVPDDFSPEPHELSVRCDPANDQQASATFTLTPAAVAGLTLTSDHGPTGSTLTATATGFTCPTVAFAWDRRAAAGTAPVDGNGSAVLALEVPADFEAERHVLAAQCDPLTVQRASATFDVDPMPRPAAARSATWWWWVIAALAVSLLVVVPLGTQRRGRRWVRDHLRVVAGAAADQPVRVREWSGNAASPDVVMRIEVHPAAGRHVLEEPDP
jgi:hypothetical protein